MTFKLHVFTCTRFAYPRARIFCLVREHTRRGCYSFILLKLFILIIPFLGSMYLKIHTEKLYFMYLHTKNSGTLKCNTLSAYTA